MALVLCTGVDPVLMKTRQLILENAGHTVVPAIDEHEIEAACSKQKFDVAVIGQNISPNVKARFAELVRAHCPTAGILELCPPYASKTLKNADAWLEMPGDPEELVNAVNSLAMGRKD
jgi:CheY-like chemotaxis protein